MLFRTVLLYRILWKCIVYFLDSLAYIPVQEWLQYFYNLYSNYKCNLTAELFTSRRTCWEALRSRLNWLVCEYLLREKKIVYHWRRLKTTFLATLRKLLRTKVITSSWARIAPGGKNKIENRTLKCRYNYIPELKKYHSDMCSETDLSELVAGYTLTKHNNPKFWFD